MEFRDIQYVLKVAEERSISNAAQKLFITQPSLSQSIARIEESLDVRLFDRSKKPLLLTFAGRQFVKTAYQILNYEKQLHKQMKDIANLKNEHITVGVSQFRGKYFFPKVLPVFYEKYPGITVSIYEDHASGLENAILTGDIDFSVEVLPVKNNELSYTFINKEKHLIVVSPAHPLNNKLRAESSTASYPPIDLCELQNETFIYLLPDSQSRIQITNFFKQENFTPKTILEVKNMETAHALAVSGIGVAFVSEVIIPYCNPEFRGKYYILKDCVPNQLNFGLVYRKNAYLSKAVLAFFAVVKDIFG
ncbi:LysR family transcriptional regulator|uniref:DNA-binding transcriptional regulator, LysR family n=1 Tax=Dendrosporobacter quercicolus TaxID=146817 RepID=A0A1G9ZG13_9FIRM|nr:LysR family transcriptional regulator [Dendrosporobacter quercicolus]NSL49808.1 LysR family transcriptional regulator [Dendrosporobacter quercicolus DSM 1736]SDN20372.1 DNA-binding transcriptional regulator, LysR family [Dendrosporobacter quercicolus]